MLLDNRNRVYFKTLSGKIYLVHRYWLFFNDAQLEAKYLSWLLERYYETFQWTCYSTVIWATVMAILYAALNFWHEELLYFIASGVVVMPSLLWAGAKLIRSPTRRQ